MVLFEMKILQLSSVYVKDNKFKAQWKALYIIILFWIMAIFILNSKSYFFRIIFCCLLLKAEGFVSRIIVLAKIWNVQWESWLWLSFLLSLFGRLFQCLSLRPRGQVLKLILTYINRKVCSQKLKESHSNFTIRMQNYF